MTDAGDQAVELGQAPARQLIGQQAPARSEVVEYHQRAQGFAVGVVQHRHHGEYVDAVAGLDSPFVAQGQLGLFPEALDQLAQPRRVCKDLHARLAEQRAARAFQECFCSRVHVGYAVVRGQDDDRAHEPRQDGLGVGWC